ncbi:TPA: hypothetical protein ACH3X1_004214 [Trebouxia sp. C0004]
MCDTFVLAADESSGLAGSIPEGWRDMVKCCRAHKPADRPTLPELLSLLSLAKHTPLPYSLQAAVAPEEASVPHFPSADNEVTRVLTPALVHGSEHSLSPPEGESKTSFSCTRKPIYLLS